MKKIILHLIIIAFSISCKESKIKSQENKTSKEIVEDSIKRHFYNTKALDSSQFVDLEEDIVISLKQDKTSHRNILLKQELIGLGVKDSLTTNVFKKYWIDFNSICYPTALSLYIDISKNKIYAYDYSFYFQKKEFSIKEVNILYIFYVNNLIVNKNTFTFKINKIEHMFLQENESIKYDSIELILTKFDTLPIFHLKINEQKDSYYSNSLRYKTYIFKSIEEKFEREDCGDFDG